MAVFRGPFHHGRGGPGGWWILGEPGIELPELDVVEISPDVAGWRHERMPTLPDGPHDQRIKRPLYAEAGVRWLWFSSHRAFRGSRAPPG